MIITDTLRLHRNRFNGTVPEAVCGDLNMITSFYADCENNLVAGESYYGDGSPEVECKCCTDCCSPGPQGEC